MYDMLAIDIALLPPPAISTRAIELSARLPDRDFQGLRLGEHALPHITLTQHFIRAAALEDAFARIAATVAGVAPLHLAVTGYGRGQSTVWMAIARTPEIVNLHVRLMDAVKAYEGAGGTAEAFAESARPRDVAWVTGFRTDSSYAAFSPHITLGHASELPPVESEAFVATTVAICHLGRFCTCARVLQQWELR